MSFSIDWLDLREPADHAARGRDLMTRLAKWCEGRDPSVLDLGSGTGSNYRALAPRIGGRWTLCDIDDGLLGEARSRHESEPTFAQTRQVDLNADLETLIEDVAPTVITGSALIDLASARWLDRLSASLPADCAFYMALSYDGQEIWTPPPPHEGQALRTFVDHQKGDKGFGPALGPDAAAHLAAGLTAAGRVVHSEESPWRLDDQTAPDLITALAAGSVVAVAEAGEMTDAELAAWSRGRHAARSVTIGHIDLLALPFED